MMSSVRMVWGSSLQDLGSVYIYIYLVSASQHDRGLGCALLLTNLWRFWLEKAVGRILR